MCNPDILLLIPARFASSRFEGKPLAKIGNKSMIQLVVENVSHKRIKAVVVTDDLRIENEIKSIGKDVVRVDDNVASGSDRIYLAKKRFFSNDNFKLIINVQGDEPLLNSEDIIKLADFHLNSQFSITTLTHKKIMSDEFFNPNRVKLALSEKNGRALYFSRAPIPFDRSGKGKPAHWWLHIGVYSFLPEALEKFANEPESSLEKIEKLEQLKALEMGMAIGALEIEKEPIGVDTPEDLEKVKKVLGL